MARRTTTDVPVEPLVRVDAIEARLGLLPEVVWRKLDSLGWRAVRDWDGNWSVRWSQAKEFVDQVEAEKVGYDEAERKRREKQMADELKGRQRYTDANEDAVRNAEQRVPGVVVSSPGAAPEPGWMDGAGEDE